MAEPSANLTLVVGDRVVYPNQGVCRVSGVETKEVAGQKLTFVTMKREEDGALVMVPQAKVQTIGLRKVATADEVQTIFTFLRSDSDKADLDWKQRARTNVERMSQGGILGLAEVVKGLQVLSELRPLPTKERELYDNARHLLVNEISVSLDITECDAEDSIDLVLFPPGRDRPKRTAAEFKPGGEDDEGLELGDDLLGLGDVETPEEPEAEAESEEGEDADDKARLSDDDVTVPMGTALVPDEQLPPKRKRGRPPKAKPEAAVAAEPAAPKKRGRPPKAKPPEPAQAPAPKKRGRPPKAKTEAAPAKPAPKSKKK